MMEHPKDWAEAHVNGAAIREAADQAWSERSASRTHASDVIVKSWPMLEPAGYGLIDEIAKLATLSSEADPNAVMGTALAYGAAMFGRKRFMRIGDTNHHARHFAALVGATSVSRKGTSLEPVRRIFTEAERVLQSNSTLPFPSGSSLKVSHGPLSSGEGLIDAIRDKRDDQDTEGVADKRLLCVEGEFGAVLRAFQRQGNNLSSTLRVAWDGWKLAPLTKHNKVCASDPHICIVGHITRHELVELLSANDLWNGFANRFLWLAVRRSKIVPFPKPMPDSDVERMGRELARVISYAHSCEDAKAELRLSNSAEDHWVAVYPELTQEHEGVVGAVTSRAAPHALRLAMTFAMFDGADRIEEKHIEAGIAFWRYAFDSASFIFGGAELDPVAQRIIEALATGQKTQTEMHGLFDRNLTSARLNGALVDLQERGRITLIEEKTAGRSRRIWRLAS